MDLVFIFFFPYILSLINLIKMAANSFHTLVIHGSFPLRVTPETFKRIKQMSGVSSIEFSDLDETSDHIKIIGSVNNCLLALSYLADRDIIIPDFSHPVDESDFYIKTIRSCMRKAKEDRLSGLLVAEDFPSCFGNMPWRFTTPRTSKVQDEKTVSSFIACRTCPIKIFTQCSVHSALKKLEECKHA